MIQKTTHAYEETLALAERLGEQLLPGTVIALHGDLGAGKTAFVTGLLRGLGGIDAVSSPTFTIVHEYTRNARLPLYHFDLYRLEGPEDLDTIGAEEYWESQGVSAIEWPSVVPEAIPEARLDVTLSYGEADERIVEIEAKGERLCRWLEEVSV